MLDMLCFHECTVLFVRVRVRVPVRAYVRRYVASGKFGERSEIFSFGVLMLEVLLGRLNQSVGNGLCVRHVCFVCG